MTKVILSSDWQESRFLRLVYTVPRVTKKTADMFGPFTSTKNVRFALKQIQAAFKLRNCSDSVYKYRTRPCLEYQIGRCSAPCVNFIDDKAYLEDCDRARKFLNGKEQDLIDDLSIKMNESAKAQNFEDAVNYRDKIASITKLLSKQVIFSRDSSDCDIIVGMQKSQYSIVVVKVRKGSIIDTNFHSQRVMLKETLSSVLTSFVSRYYLSAPLSIPEKLVVWPHVANRALLVEALSIVKGKKVQLKVRLMEDEKNWLNFAKKNLDENHKLSDVRERKYFKRMQAFSQTINQKIKTVDCLDISHHMGKDAVGSCVHFDEYGADKKNWRSYNIPTPLGGDDYASLYYVVKKRYNSNDDDFKAPDLLLIDGGKGQVSSVLSALAQAKHQPKIVMGISKGPARKSGAERLYLFDGNKQLELFPTDLARLFLQAVRDEAHRFAISKHRKKSRAHVSKTTLLDVSSIGPAIQKKLLNHFGGLKLLKLASIEDIQRINGIGEAKATLIHNFLHSKDS